MSNTNFSMERSRKDIAYFYKWLGYTWGKHIGEWMDLYSDRKGASVHRVCIIAPRDHSKSTTLRVKLLHQCLFEKKGDGSPFTCWLISASKDTAAQRLEEIRADLKKHPQLRKYISPSKGNKLELHFTNGAWIRATSVGSAIRGAHPACVAFDDVLVDSDDTNPKTLQSWYKKAIIPMLSPDSWFYCVGTPMSMVDLYHTEMLDNPVWKSAVYSAITNYDEWRASDGEIKPEVLWEEYRNADYLLEQREGMGELAFVQEYLCRVIDDEAAVYPRELVRKHLNMDDVFQTEKDDNCKYNIGFDPAHGLGKDFSVMIVLKQDQEGFIHFVNMWRRNDFPPDRQADMIIEWNKRYGYPAFASEDVGFQQLYKSLIEQKNANVDYRGSKVSNRTLKQGILNRLRVWFERELIIFPYGDHNTRMQVNTLFDELETHAWKNGLIEDLGKHNDCVMAFAHAIDQFTAKGFEMPVIMKKAEAGEWLGGSGSKVNRGAKGIGGKVINR